MRREKGRIECYITQDSISKLNTQHFFYADSSRKTVFCGEEKSIYTVDTVSVVYNQRSFYSFHIGLTKDCT